MLDLNNREIAANLGIDSTMVWRIVKLFRETGDVQKKTQPGAIKELTSVTEFFIVSQVLEHPCIMLHELQAVLIEQTDCC